MGDLAVTQLADVRLTALVSARGAEGTAGSADATPSRLTYRPELDGLRAVAVLAVMA
jgi:hypothetical protein